MSIDAGRIEHLGGSISGNQVGLRSASDIRIEGASVTAVDALSVQAVGDVTVASTVETLSGGGYHQYSTTQLQRVAGLYVTGANGSGVLSVMGGGDVTLQAAQIHNAGSDGVTQLVAGNNLTLGAQTLSHSTDTTANDRNFQRSSETTHAVSSVQGAGNVVLAAGNDLTLTAAQVGAGKGLALQAGRDIGTLDLVFGDRQVYAAINDIIPRADFFGAMARQTGAVWFAAAESQSRVNLSGPGFDFLAGWNKYWGAGDVMDNWRSAAGNEIMSHGYGNFSDIYFNGNKIDLKEWSVKQLVSEQNDPSLQVIHEYYIKNMTQATIYLMQKAGHVDNVLNPSDRVNTGCVNMGYGKGCGDAYLNGNSGN
ncbi:hypothetical protein FE36_17210 [Xanthomonas oryzae pv. oryzicola]|nr:hypothetical protein FE36_17210 [Xanthomonas oryzae pv. oryzicola]